MAGLIHTYMSCPVSVYSENGSIYHDFLECRFIRETSLKKIFSTDPISVTCIFGIIKTEKQRIVSLQFFIVVFLDMQSERCPPRYVAEMCFMFRKRHI